MISAGSLATGDAVFGDEKAVHVLQSQGGDEESVVWCGVVWCV